MMGVGGGRAVGGGRRTRYTSCSYADIVYLYFIHVPGKRQGPQVHMLYVRLVCICHTVLGTPVPGTVQF